MAAGTLPAVVRARGRRSVGGVAQAVAGVEEVVGIHTPGSVAQGIMHNGPPVLAFVGI